MNYVSRLIDEASGAVPVLIIIDSSADLSMYQDHCDKRMGNVMIDLSGQDFTQEMAVRSDRKTARYASGIYPTAITTANVVTIIRPVANLELVSVIRDQIQIASCANAAAQLMVLVIRTRSAINTLRPIIGDDVLVVDSTAITQ